MSGVQPLKFEAPDSGEEIARADLYGVLEILFYEPPSQALLDTIAKSVDDAAAEGDGVLQQTWKSLADACGKTDANRVRDEYESLFVGVGKPEVMLYGSWYLSGFMMEKPLAALRDELAQLGLQRDARMPESEDHIAALCEVMRYLIASNDPLHANLETQRRFFAEHLQPWANAMCDAIAGHPQAHFYRSVAQLAKTFFEVEMQAFDML
ncbi:MAG: TorD/DmsD family molecular chaperone [Noviherbaspirillum sp.]